ncbi:MAG: hypothetical protein DRO04_02555 [Candidatus Iainarchaeum archaeon]|uniref:S-methyl-5-thioribose-1-phosphate isomerase n=1 Tax=Candidatus Iainarchaeum sp. TaxID=3101447 RepID=A0A497JG41_9ARCH|nr:MAG: hypothetical protein DRO04_02555 [Candidatus Diapherotrites archaeon]
MEIKKVECMQIPKEIKKIVKDIKDMKIQGASKVRSATIKAIKIFLRKDKSKNVESFYKNFYKVLRLLVSSRPTEPEMRTAIRILLKESKRDLKLDKLKMYLLSICEGYEKSRELALKKIAEYGSRLFEKNSIILTHCHSHTVEAILKEAYKKGLIEKVYCTETRPLFQGRKTAKSLVKAGIPTTMIVDSAVASIMHEVDVFITGADAVIEDGSVINKIGTYTISIVANRFNVPHYAACSTHKFDPITSFGFREKIEERSPKEVWQKRPKGLKIINKAFDITPSIFVKKIITEKGVFGSEAFASYMYQKLKLGEKELEKMSLQKLLEAKA